MKIKPPGVPFLVLFFSFNCTCTYQAEPSEGSDQDKASYVLATKQRVVKLVCHWVALYGLLLKDDPVALDFLEVRFQPYTLYISVKASTGVFIVSLSLEQKLKKEVGADFRLSSIVKEQFRERRRTRMWVEGRRRRERLRLVCC